MTLNRRKIFSMLAALPFIGSAGVAIAATAAVEKPIIGPASPTNLMQVKDLLLPGLRAEAMKHPRIEFDIVVDYTNDAILVKGYNSENKSLLGFAVTREEINSGLYKRSFRQSVLSLAKCLQET